MRVRRNDPRRFGGLAALLALIGMLVLSTGAALLVAGPASAARTSASDHQEYCGPPVQLSAEKRWDDCDGGSECDEVVDKKRWDDCDGGSECDEVVGKKKWDDCDEDPTCDVDVPSRSVGERPTRLCLVRPGDPTFTDPSCDTDPVVTLPEANEVGVLPYADRTAEVIAAEDIDGVHFEVSGDLAPGGTVQVDATALPGYVLAEDATTSWSHTFSTPEGCETVVEPPTEPVVLPEVVTPTVVAAGVTAPTTGSRATAGGLIGAGLLMLVGAGAVAMLRRRPVTA